MPREGLEFEIVGRCHCAREPIQLCLFEAVPVCFEPLLRDLKVSILSRASDPLKIVEILEL